MHTKVAFDSGYHRCGASFAIAANAQLGSQLNAEVTCASPLQPAWPGELPGTLLPEGDWLPDARASDVSTRRRTHRHTRREERHVHDHDLMTDGGSVPVK